MTNLLDIIRGAARPGAPELVLDEAAFLADQAGTPTAAAPPAPAAADAPPAVAASLAALSASAAQPQSTYADGYTAAMTRMGAVLGADGIKGNASRMAAAFDLATAAPGMAADAVVAFVTANVAAAPVAAGAAETAAAPAAAPAAAAVPAAPVATYEQQRLAAAQLAMPGAAQPAKAESGLRKAVNAEISAIKAR
ncbi:hypothetical protein BJF92_12155 [Rhizobium rhizosphaerae]|uniref:Uncharacterized protein n=1 Tax=Xaviernesmea rhizosphaerae TaxID=1672749 RepID=A0A1Q9AN21_9HYPH|nr:hypothetical protein [Xaviernesmea rhizosphaerae]OLP56817.1 hypothetical protein BJF92_12155 [Xaviernesmea rhizosphaerae]